MNKPMTKERDEIIKLLPEKKELTPEEERFYINFPNNARGRMISGRLEYNQALFASTDKLTEKVATVEEVKKPFDKFITVKMNKIGTEMKAMVDMQLRDKIVEALRREFIILRRQ